MEDDSWDLSAVVRSCRPSEPAAGAREARWLFPPPTGPVLAVEGGKGGAFMRLTDAFGGRAAALEMGELCNKSLFPGDRQPPQLPEGSSWSPRLAAAAAATAPGPHQTPPRRKPDRPASQTPRSRRRKNLLKKMVRHVAADGLSSDTWAWRKYGQKPIKGSPYPRGYYRCSSSKGCPARKQLERCRTDPATFIVTYTSEHNHPMPTHRNSLAGSTRHKFSSPAAAASGDHPQISNSEASPLSSTTVPELSPTTPRPHSEEIADEEEAEEEDDEEDERELLVEDMQMMGEDDLFFLSSEEGGAASATAAEVAAFFDGKEDFDDHLFPLPWLTSNCSSTAASAAAGAFSSS